MKKVVEHIVAMETFTEIIKERVKKDIPYRLRCLLGSELNICMDTHGISFTNSGDYMTVADLKRLAQEFANAFPPEVSPTLDWEEVLDGEDKCLSD